MSEQDRTKYVPKARKIDSRKTERKLGEKGGGRGVPGSGGFFGLPGDFSWKDLGALGESKETEKKSKALHIDELRRIQGEATEAGLEPVLALTYHSMRPPFEKEWGVVRLEFLLELLRVYNCS